MASGQKPDLVMSDLRANPPFGDAFLTTDIPAILSFAAVPLLDRNAPPSKKLCGAGPFAANPAADVNLEQVSCETNPAHSGVPAGRFMHLRRNRDSVGETVVSMDRDLLTLVTVIFPESLADDHRYKIVARVNATLRNNQFTSGKVPNFESLAGENLRFPRKTYADHVFQWPTRDDARCFRKALPIAYRLQDGSYIDIKPYVDPGPEFTAAKANGETHLLLRNIPIGYSLDAVKKMLLSQCNKAGRKWLRDVKLLHKILDPYEEVYHPQMAGLFEQIPAVIWLPGILEPMLLNLSCHCCAVCNSNHRTSDHSSFAVMRKSRINNPFQISVAQLQSVNVPSAFKADPELLYIGIDIDFEVWTCVACSYVCGWALDSAVRHMQDSSHIANISLFSNAPTPIDELGGTKVKALLQHESIAFFLSKE
ncbi:unnamed protein product [Closterium sp. Naga37s-1]|nr:unnamed protein product [Closterium sp. Naga37s-1]